MKFRVAPKNLRGEESCLLIPFRLSFFHYRACSKTVLRGIRIAEAGVRFSLGPPIMISYDDFKKIELKTAKIENAERIEGSEKLIKLSVSLGEEKRQIIAGIGKKYEPENLIGKTIIIVANLEPRNLMGLESQGMLLAASNDAEGPILLTTINDISSGSAIN